MEPMTTIALRAARKGAELIETALTHGKPLEISSKGQNDYVTNLDNAVEKEVLYHLKKAYPEHGFLTEETGIIEGKDQDYQWIIDPIDGTTNFIHGIPHYCISIACTYKGKLEHAVILDPIKRDEFTASRGKGARLNDKRIRVTNAQGLEGSLIATGIPFNGERFEKIDNYLACLKEVAGKTAGIRRMGSAALDLAYVACGRVDGFWEIQLKPWDVAAGILLIKEAGGMVSDFAGGNDMMASGNIVCGSPKVFKPLLQAVGKYLK